MSWFGMQCKLHVCPVTNSDGDEGSGWSRLNPAWGVQWEEVGRSGGPC